MSKSLSSNLPNLVYSKVPNNKLKSAIAVNVDTNGLASKKPDQKYSNNVPLKVESDELLQQQQSISSESTIDNSQEVNTSNDSSIPVHLNSNGYPSDKDLSTYARKIQKRFKEGMQAVKESMQFALSDEDFDVNMIDNKK